MRGLAAVKRATDAIVTLGIATGASEVCLKQMSQKSEVNRSMQRKLQVCGDSQVEYVLNRGCIGINKVNHFLQVPGGLLLRNGCVMQKFDDDQRQALNRVFPGLTSDRGWSRAGFSRGGCWWTRLAICVPHCSFSSPRSPSRPQSQKHDTGCHEGRPHPTRLAGATASS